MSKHTTRIFRLRFRRQLAGFLASILLFGLAGACLLRWPNIFAPGALVVMGIFLIIGIAFGVGMVPCIWRCREGSAFSAQYWRQRRNYSQLFE